MTLRARSQVLFAECAGGLVQVDGTLLESPADHLPAGMPVTLVLRLPVSGVVAAVVEATVHRWADDLGVIDLEVISDTEPAHAVLSDGTATVRLDVEAAGTLAA